MAADELVSAVETGTVEELVAIIDRLQTFLPEYGRTKTDESFSEHWKAVVDLEQKLVWQKALMREAALRIVASVKRNWTAKEIKKASGYSTTEE